MLFESIGLAAAAVVFLCWIWASCASRFLGEHQRALAVGWGSLICSTCVFVVWTLFWMLEMLWIAAAIP